jgi:hypothetical protein
VPAKNGILRENGDLKIGKRVLMGMRTKDALPTLHHREAGPHHRRLDNHWEMELDLNPALTYGNRYKRTGIRPQMSDINS